MLPSDFKSGSASFAVGPGLSTELTSPLVSPRRLVRGFLGMVLLKGRVSRRVLSWTNINLRSLISK